MARPHVVHVQAAAVGQEVRGPAGVGQVGLLPNHGGLWLEDVSVEGGKGWEVELQACWGKRGRHGSDAAASEAQPARAAAPPRQPHRCPPQPPRKTACC